MTVIAWDGKVLASDSMESTDYEMYLGNCKKLFRLKSGGMIGTAGDSDHRAILAIFDNVKDENDLPTKAEIEATRTDGLWIVVLPNRTAWYVACEALDDKARFSAWLTPYNGKTMAVGHGSDFAIGAMAAGKTSTESVKIACIYSPFCRGPVQMMKLEDKPKEKINRKRKPALIEGAE